MLRQFRELFSGSRFGNSVNCFPAVVASFDLIEGMDVVLKPLIGMHLFLLCFSESDYPVKLAT